WATLASETKKRPSLGGADADSSGTGEDLLEPMDLDFGSSKHSMVPLERLELPTISLGRNCSSIELQRPAPASLAKLPDAVSLRSHRRQVLVPLGQRPLDAAHEPGGAMRRLRAHAQAPAHLRRRPVALLVVAAQAAGHQVLPGVLPPARTRQ